jgi:hypothetical protein
VAAPKAFGAALGGALAALDGDDEDGDGDGVAGAGDASDPALAATEANRAVQAKTAPGKLVAPAPAPARRTVAVRQPVQPPRPKAHEVVAHDAVAHEAIEPPRVPTDMTDLIPRTTSRVPILVAAAAFAVAGVAGGVWFAMRKPEAAAAQIEPTAIAPAAAASPAVSAPPATTTAAGTTTAAVAPPPSMPLGDKRPDKHRARSAAPARPAHLTITSDVKADAFVDGRFVRGTPIVDLELSPGRHTVRVVSAAPGLRLIPREQTVELKPGELKELRMELK